MRRVSANKDVLSSRLNSVRQMSCCHLLLLLLLLLSLSPSSLLLKDVKGTD